MGSIGERVIVDPVEYDVVKYTSLLTILRNPNEYHKSLKGIQKKLSDQFPLLRNVQLPLSNPKTSFIEGILLPQVVIDDLHLSEEQYSYYGLPIFAVIHENYKETGIQVYDCAQRINWENIDIEYRHCIPLSIIKDEDKWKRCICTHNKIDINQSNCINNVLMSAFHLFQEYRKYEKTGSFDLACLPHGQIGGHNNGR